MRLLAAVLLGGYLLWPDSDLMDWDATKLTPLGAHWLSLQPGGANDPVATVTPGATATAEPRRVWLPWMGEG